MSRWGGRPFTCLMSTHTNTQAPSLSSGGVFYGELLAYCVVRLLAYRAVVVNGWSVTKRAAGARRVHRVDEARVAGNECLTYDEV